MRKIENRFFEAVEVKRGTWQILGQGGELCYLVEGSERALLIDALEGAGQLKPVVEGLTDRPVTLALTHGHLDHNGAVPEFGEVYVHPDDIALMYSKRHSDTMAKLAFATMKSAIATHQAEGLTLNDICPMEPVRTYPVYDGDVFSLGDRDILVIGVPGHTFGTLVFLDERERLLFSGDACNINTLLALEGSTSIEQYLESLHHLKGFEDRYDVMYGGHGRNTVDRSIVDDAIAMAQRILAGTDDAEEAVNGLTGEKVFYGGAHNPDYTPACGGLANIQYHPLMLWKKDVRRFEPEGGPVR